MEETRPLRPPDGDAQPTGASDAAPAGRLRTLQCPVCGATLPWTLPEGELAPGQPWRCPVCGRASDGRENEGEPRFEERTIRCLPYDLDRLAQAEAVDGWTLVETTPASDVPGAIEALFRRPARPGSGGPATMPGEPVAEAATTRTRGEAAAPRPKTRRSGPPQMAKRPAPTRSGDPAAAGCSQRSAAGSWARLTLGLLGLAVGLWILDSAGIGGLLLALVILWQIRRAVRRRRWFDR